MPIVVGLTVVAEIATTLLGWGLQPTYYQPLYGLFDVVLVVIGVLIIGRHRRNPVGWILLFGGVQDAVVSTLASAYGLRALVEGWPFGPQAEWIGFATWSLGPVTWTLALLFVPNGRLPGPRWRLVAWTSGLGYLLYEAGWTLDPANGDRFATGTNPWTVPGLPHGAMVAAGGVLLCAALLGSVASVVVRRRRAGPVERLQLQWVALSGLVILTLLVLCVPFYFRWPLLQAATPIALVVAAGCLAAAVLRYRLFDVGLIVSRTVVYLTLSLLLGATYGLTAIVLGATLGSRSAWTTASATLVAAALFRPLRRRVQNAVNRRFDRAAYDATLRIDAFLERLRAGTEHPERVEDLLRDVLGDPSLRVLLRLPVSGDYSDVRGSTAAPDADRPAVHLDRDGTPDVVVHYAATDDPARETAVRSAVERSRLAIEMARLGVDLNRQLAELDRSRARIAVAADDERRRIRRDLHDGAQQRLVTVGIALRSLENRLRAKALTTEADDVDAAVEDVASTIEELRDLTDQLPLTQLDAGIGAAFRELAGRAPLPVEVEAPVERFGPGVEATAYFVGCEGLTNVIKHARASAVTLSAVRRDRTLVVTVSDDGVGGATARPGSGLTGLADRVAAAGGRLQVCSDRTGTRLEAELPCG